jgi:hypothetical protein
MMVTAQAVEIGLGVCGYKTPYTSNRHAGVEQLLLLNIPEN